MKKKGLLFALLMTFIFFAASAEAAPLWDTSADLKGSRHTGEGGGLIADAGKTWANGSFIVDWEITFDSGFYTYIYTITRLAEQGAVSHMLLETTQDENPFIFTTPYSSDDIEGPKEWTSSGNRKLPNPLWGIKFDIEEEELLELYELELVQYIITTDRAPVWGVAWWKDGDPGGIAYTAALGYNDYKTNESLIELAFIARPNSAPVPEPATMLLLGFGLVGLAIAGRRNFLK